MEEKTCINKGWLGRVCEGKLKDNGEYEVIPGVVVTEYICEAHDQMWKLLNGEVDE